MAKENALEKRFISVCELLGVDVDKHVFTSGLHQYYLTTVNGVDVEVSNQCGAGRLRVAVVNGDLAVSVIASDLDDIERVSLDRAGFKFLDKSGRNVFEFTARMSVKG